MRKRKYHLVKDYWDYYMDPSRGVSRLIRDFKVVGKCFKVHTKNTYVCAEKSSKLTLKNQQK